MTHVTKIACPYTVGDSVEVVHYQRIKAIVTSIDPPTRTIHTQDSETKKDWRTICHPNPSSPETSHDIDDMLKPDSNIETSPDANRDMEADNDIMKARSTRATVVRKASPSPTSPVPETPSQLLHNYWGPTPCKFSGGALLFPSPCTEWWVEQRAGKIFCKVCNAFATAEHVASKKHKSRVEWQSSCVGFFQINGGLGVLPPNHWGDPSLYEWRHSEWAGKESIDGFWWCLLCRQWADNARVESRRHRNRSASPEDYLPTMQHNVSEQPRHNSEYLGIVRTTPQDNYHERLRPHVASGRNTLSDGVWKKQWSSVHGRYYYWHGGTRIVQWDLPADGVWKKQWSSEHGRYYYWHSVTRVVRWDLPACAITGLNPPSSDMTLHLASPHADQAAGTKWSTDVGQQDDEAARIFSVKAPPPTLLPTAWHLPRV